MILPAANVLVYAHREDAPDHAAYLAWLTNLIESDEAYGMAEVRHPLALNQSGMA